MSHHALRECLQETLGVFDPCGPPLTTPEVAERLDLGRRSTYDRLRRLAERDRIETKKVGANARVWWRPPSEFDSAREDSDSVREDSGTVREGALPASGPAERESLRRKQFESLVAAVGEYAIVLLDRTGRIRTWNSGAERINGYEEADALGEHVSLLYCEDDREAGVPEADLAAAAENGSIEDEGWRLRADGSRFRATVTVTAIRDEDGDIAGYTKVTRDMSDRLERERQLRRERDLVERILETAPVGLAIYEADGSIDRINTRVRRQLGIDAVDAPERRMSDRRLYDSDGEPLDGDEYPVQRVLESEEPVSDLVVQHDGPDGDRRWITITASPVFDEGRLERIVVAGKDVTELKRTQRELEYQRDEIESELLRAYERGEAAFLAVDENWRLVHANERAAELIDLTAERAAGENFWEVVPDVVGTEFQERYERALETQESVTFEAHFEPLDSWFEVDAYPDESGLSVYFRDVTERKERERELEESRHRLRTVVDSFPNGAIALVDEDLRYVAVGGTVLDGVSPPSEELEGKHLHEALPPESADRYVPRYEDALDGTANSFEETSGGRTYLFRALPVRDDDGEVFAAIGMSQDITEQRERQRELERRIDQQEAVADLSQYALEHADVDDLLSDAAERVAETLDTDYSAVLDLDAETDTLRLRQGVGWDDGVVGRATVPAVVGESQAAYALDSHEPVIVSDLATDARFDESPVLSDHGVTSGIRAVIGCPHDPWGILAAHDTESKAFADRDVSFVQSVAAILAAAIGRRQDERALRRQREQLAALNNLNAVVQEITDAVLTRSTREEIEATVCEHLANSDSYQFAWIGEADVSTRTVALRTEAGLDEYLDDVTVSIDSDDERSDGPTARAFRTGEMWICRDAGDDPWRDRLRSRGVRSAAAIPIVHEGTVYGVLNLYADRPNAFEGREKAVIEQLGEVVGHAIAATERKRALLSDEVVELDFRVRNVFEDLETVESAAGTISFEQIVPIGEEEYLAYGTVTPDGVEGFRALAEAMPHGERVTIREDGGETRFEFLLSEPPVLSTVASLGGSIERAVIEDGDYWMTFHLAPSANVRRLIDAVRETYPSARLLKRQQVSRTRSLEPSDSGVPVGMATVDLTERQRTTLEVAYRAGFFEWPRSATGEEVAETMGISPPTFHQHLRKAERKVVESVVDARGLASAGSGAE